MKKQMQLFTTTLFLSTALSYTAHAATINESPQNTLIGATTTIQAQGNYGAGVKFAVIDTGISSSWIGFNSGNITSATCIGSNGNSAACSLTSANSDDHGHGTFVASEMIGSLTNRAVKGVTETNLSNSSGTAVTVNMSGVAPNAQLLAVKVLAANGSGTSADTFSAIKYAVDHGATIMNLSLGPTGTGAQQAAFFSGLAGAINYAADKGATIVFAGGNSAVNLADGAKITGFTDNAVKHMIFVGATDSKKNISFYSNKPGSSGFQTTSGTFIPFKNLWVMADGGNAGTEDIIGARYSNTGVCSGYSCITNMSGTSMAAPEVAGAAGLLAARWSILQQDNSSVKKLNNIKDKGLAQLIEGTTTALGGLSGTATYGYGFINLATAFNPVGTLSVMKNDGTLIALSTNTTSKTQLGTMLTSGALGNAALLKTQLTNFTVYDTYLRDFQSNISSYITFTTTSNPVTAPGSSLVFKPITISKTFALADGSALAFNSVKAEESPVINATNREKDRWVTTFASTGGDTFAAGYGLPASASFSQALWGDNGAAANASNTLGVSSALLGLASGGVFTSYGTQLDKDTRMGFTWSNTAERNDLTNSNLLTAPDARAVAIGMTHKVTKTWTAGLTMGMLKENNGLLGSTYLDDGIAGFGKQHTSSQVGISSSFTLGKKTELLFDASMVKTDGASLGQGIINDVSSITSRSMGAALAQRDVVQDGDNLMVSLRKPLRVISGSVGLAQAGLDDNGDLLSHTQRVGLTPTGSETDFSVGYTGAVHDNLSWDAALAARQDADNVAGNNDIGVRVGASLAF